MMKLVSKAVMGLAVLALAACAGLQDTMPDWMPGSGAVDVTLSGAQEVPPVQTSATGSGTFRVASDGAISGSVATQGMQGTMAHIHHAPKGRNGPVIVPLAKKGDTYVVPEGRKLTGAQTKAFEQGELYVNVHSARHKGGELRAQLQP